MKKTLAVLLLLAASASAQTKRPEMFPSDYKPSPCAPAVEKVCKSFTPVRLRDAAGDYRAFHIDDKWLAAHWDELMAAYKPLCAKMSNCMTVVDNTWQYCRDLVRLEFLAVCERFPKGSKDRENCEMISVVYHIGFGNHDALEKEAHACAAAQPQAERTLEAWLWPEKIPLDFNGEIDVHAYDAETRIPVRALLEIDAGKLRSIEGPVAKTGYPNKWTARLKRVPRADGHSDVVLPTVTLKATGYKPLTLTVPMEVPRMTVSMSPSPSELKVGMNTITVTAKDAATGAPVEARVMAGKMVLGHTNKALELELTDRDQLPEIWVTSLFDRYSDAVVVSGTK
ncbi:MAG TPA: hypothetical protein VGF28_00240 [Thermoanaerobaculia bacterium]|jgi:hypothetical protein